MIKLIDTHQHLIYRDHFSYAWSDSLPLLAGRDFTVASYQRLTDGKDVAGSIFMETDAGQDYHNETRFVAELATDPANQILGIVSSCRPELDDGFEPWLDECASLPVVGFRRILHEVGDDMSRSDTFRRNVLKIGERGHVFDMVYRADQLEIAAELAKFCDDMTLVLDHCGVPDITGGEFELWSHGITSVADLPNVCCKISGVLAYCSPGNATIDAIRSYVDHVLESFGTERLVWGSDWPVVALRSELTEWIDIFRQLIAGLSEDEANAICNGNARRIYDVEF